MDPEREVAARNAIKKGITKYCTPDQKQKFKLEHAADGGSDKSLTEIVDNIPTDLLNSVMESMTQDIYRNIEKLSNDLD